MKSARIPVHAVIFLAVFLSIGPLWGQASNFSLSLGAGMPELLNAGVSFNAGKGIFGATIGTFPVFEERLFTAGVNTGLRFAGKSIHTELPPWYALAGLNLVRDKSDNSVGRYTYLSLRLGREMNLSPRTAISLDGGILFETSNDIKSSEPGSEWHPGESWFPVLPSLSLKFIIRLPSRDTGGPVQ
ncbi:MAG: hypothetical protein AB9888_18245 [Bacteroidales bacterium]